MTSRSVRRHYERTGPLRVRAETHRRYEERPVDLHAESARALTLAGDESVLDVGCGPGAFLRWLCGAGHAGRLLGLDQSAAMLREGAAVGGGIAWLRGDAQRLPLADGAVDRVSARHMLYHVAEIDATLRECRRVLVPGGVLLAVTNAAVSLPQITTLVSDLFARFDIVYEGKPDARFCIENAEPMLRGVFDTVDVAMIDNALLFTEPRPIIRYVESILPSAGVRPASPLARAMRAWLERETAARLAALGGVWRDPKVGALYRCAG